MSYGSLWDRLVRACAGRGSTRGIGPALPADLDASVMTLEAVDRLHAKQGRSTATGRLPSAAEALTGPRSHGGQPAIPLCRPAR